MTGKPGSWRPRLLAAGLLILLSGSCVDREDEPTDASLASLQVALAEDPDDLEMNLRYGRALIKSGQPNLAVWALSKAARSPSLEGEARRLLARAQAAQGNYDDAIRESDLALELAPDDLEMLRIRSASALELRRYDEALESIEEGLWLDASDIQLLMLKMRVLLLMDRGDESGDVIRSIRSRLADFEGMDPRTRRFAEGQYCAIEAMFTHESGDSDRAETLFSECIDQHPTHQAVLESAFDFFDGQMRPDRSDEVLQAAIELEPANTSLRVLLANRYEARGERAQAERLLLDVSDTQPAIWAALADLYTAREQRPEAIEAIANAIGSNPDGAPEEWKLHHADLLIQERRFEEARRSIDTIEADAYRAVTEGRIALATDRPEEALAHFDVALRLWPDGTVTRLLAGIAAEQVGDFARAESEYREAYRSDQSYTDAGLRLAGLLVSRSLKTEALALAQAYLQANRQEALGYTATIRLATAADRPELAARILAAFRRTPGLQAAATAFGASFLLETRGPEEARALIEAAGLDLTDAANADVLRVECQALESLNRSDEAVALLDTALATLETASSRDALVADRARLVAHAGDIDSAREQLRSARSSAASGSPPILLRAAGELAELAGDREAALRHFEAYREAAHEDDWKVALARGRLHVDVSKKEREFRRALRLNPRSPEATSALADHLLTNRGDPREIEELRNRARRFADPLTDLVEYRPRPAKGDARAPREPEEER